MPNRKVMKAADERAREPIWQFFQANQNDPERASTAALSLAGLGDDRVLPYLRAGLDAGNEELVANSVAAMIMMGQTKDLPHLRQAHRRRRYRVDGGDFCVLSGKVDRSVMPLTKTVARNHLALSQPIHLMGGVFRFQYTENKRGDRSHLII